MSIVNSVIVSNDEKTADIYFNDVPSEKEFSFVSGGYNYIGNVNDAVAEPAKTITWLDTDSHGKDCTYASIFGENKINDKNVINPVKYFAGASGEQIETAVAAWGLPEGLNLTTDASGKTRVTGMTPGADSFTEAEIKDFTTGIITTLDDTADAPRLVKVAKNVYTIEGASEGIMVYTVNGSTVAMTSGNTVDLNSFANGLYIIKSGNSVFKVIK